MRYPHQYETWEEFLDGTVRAGKVLEVTIFPPDNWRVSYLAMRMENVGYTDTRRYRFGKDRRARSEEYGRMMVYDYLSCSYDVTVEIAKEEGPLLHFTWNPAKWRESDLP